MLIWSGCDGDEELPPDESTEDIGAAEDEPPGAESECVGEGACAGDDLCDVYDCGGRPARFNHFGCPRVPCDTDADCPSGEACFALAFDRSCEPSRTECFEEDGACTCTSSDDCSGVLDAHCLPTEFYPPADYCDPSAWGCQTLPGWIEALSSAAEARAETDLGAALDGCAEQASAALEACP